MNELEKTRAKILGLLIQDARLYAGRSVQDCAQVLGIDATDFASAERGNHILSLPEIEVLTMYLKVPLAHFWGTETLSRPHKADYGDLLQLRRQVVGGLLRQARVQAGRTHEELAQEIKVDAGTIAAYESGKMPMPLFALERMGKYLGAPLDYFMDQQRGPLAEHEAEQKMQQRFADLPPEMRSFVVEPINRSYIETAMRLSDLDVHRLRQIAEGILDITF